ncbi:four helix bundle protein [Chryseobacterium sp. SNU WT5]|uniref:four helix bundle protein n=1 Tax=Chryseobacterium sp. SNU WT5 TaxID=2594269 RepID=UPI00117F5CB2|nr:four helix bundle protein [Chryseobacterium sp. SNU WT5]QDP84428.1 four helix bundle protein [Chryseobacterium sp. SNU WT5]
MEKRNEILELSIQFALDIIEFTEILESKRKFVIANQLLKSGTSVGANVFESQSAESRADFIHKLKIADKEAKESEYWLLLCEKSRSYPSNEDLKLKLLSIQKLLSKIISTSKINK